MRSAAPTPWASAVNVALPAHTGDAGWLRAFHAVVPQLVQAFAPEVIVSQHGCDSHKHDPLTHLNTSVDAQREAALSIAGLAAKVLRGPLGRDWAAEATTSPTWCRWSGATWWPSPPDGLYRWKRRFRRAGAATCLEKFGPQTAGADGRGRRHLVAVLGGRVRPQRRRGPHRHGHPQGSLPAPWAGSLVRLIPVRLLNARKTDAVGRICR